MCSGPMRSFSVRRKNFWLYEWCAERFFLTAFIIPAWNIPRRCHLRTYIRAGLDGTGTKIAIGKITTGLKWKAVQESMILHGEYRSEFEDQCEELGMLMAASLESGII